MKTLIRTLLAGAVLSGCATPSLMENRAGGLPGLDISVPEMWSTQTQDRAIDFETRATGTGWLARFGDDTLDTLVQDAYRANPDLDQLRANLDRAEALTDRARSGLLPVLDGLAGGSRRDAISGADASSASLNMSVSASWEPDLWGRLGSGVTASEMDREAALADLDAARQVLAASVIETYFLAIEADRLADVSARNLEALSETLGFVEVQYERGLRSGQDLVLIRADVASATASRQQADGAARQARRALETLIGLYPDTDRALASTLPDVPAFELTDQPVDILRQRPDLQAASHRVAAAYARHDVARAAQKPRLSLGGTFGGSEAQLGDIFDPANLAATLFVNLSAPLFDGGQRGADVAVAKADIDNALAAYRRAAIDAFGDVEDQLDQGYVLRAREAALLSALSDARQALKFTRFRYESAEVDLLNVLQVQQRVSFIEAQLVSLRRARLTQYINLSLALGITPDAV